MKARRFMYRVVPQAHGKLLGFPAPQAVREGAVIAHGVTTRP